MGKKISELNELTTLASNDLLVVVDTSAGQTKHVQFQNLNPGENETTVTADYTITKDNEVVYATGDVTVTLPAASNAWQCAVANIGTGTVTIQRAGSDAIGIRGIGTSTEYLLAEQYATVALKGNGGLLWLEF